MLPAVLHIGKYMWLMFIHFFLIFIVFFFSVLIIYLGRIPVNSGWCLVVVHIPQFEKPCFAKLMYCNNQPLRRILFHVGQPDFNIFQKCEWVSGPGGDHSLSLLNESARRNQRKYVYSSVRENIPQKNCIFVLDTTV